MTMQFLVICRPAEGGDQDEFKRLVPSETAALQELKAKGLLTEAWSPGRPGAVLMLDVPDEMAVASLVAAFPLVQAAMITTEIIPLHLIDL
jgi:muconolactone delta-isomerase